MTHRGAAQLGERQDRVFQARELEGHGNAHLGLSFQWVENLADGGTVSRDASPRKRFCEKYLQNVYQVLKCAHASLPAQADQAIPVPVAEDDARAAAPVLARPEDEPRLGPPVRGRAAWDQLGDGDPHREGQSHDGPRLREAHPHAAQ